MKKRVLIFIGIFAGVVAVLIIMAFVFMLPFESKFEVPEDAKYVISYSTGEYNDREKSQINYLKDDGSYISSTIVDNVSDEGAFGYNPLDGSYHFFTHDVLYFNDLANNDSIMHQNNEMLGIYKFASEDGNDAVYQSGYIDSLDLFYKVVPHGLAYAQDNLGFFDLFITYDKKKIVNTRIPEVSEVIVDKASGDIYILNEDETNNSTLHSQEFTYNYGRFNRSLNQYMFEKRKLNVSGFFSEHDIDNSCSITPGSGIIYKGTLYQIVHFVFEDEEKSHPYILEIELDKDGGMALSDAYALKIDDPLGFMTNIPTTVKNDEIVFYSYNTLPSQIITLNLKSKEVSVWPYFSEEFDRDKKLFATARLIGNEMFVCATNGDVTQFSISHVDTHGNMTEVISDKLPRPKINATWWVSDFYILDRTKE